MKEATSIQEIYQRYPKLFPKNIISCDKGWLSIIEQMCAAIQIYLDNEVSGDLILFKFNSIREEHGVLNIFFEGGDEVIKLVIKHCQKLSYKICELCGKKGALFCSSKWRNWSNTKTLCESHAVELFFYRIT